MVIWATASIIDAADIAPLSFAPASTDRSIQHEVSGVTMQFEERSIDFSLLMAHGDGPGIRRTTYGHLAKATSESSSLVSPAYEVPIHNPEPWLDVIVLWKIASGDAHAIIIELQGSTDGETWTDWHPIRCMCCGLREVEENVIVSQLNTMDAATRFVRFRVLWPDDGDAVELEWVKLHFISPGASPPEMLEPPRKRTTTSEIGTLSTARPAVVSRASWGCPDGDGSRWSPSFANFTHLTVHHTVTPNSDTDWAARVRAIWNQHAISQNWGDIGYHFLIAGNGTIYQGRSGSITGDPIAAHVGGHNTRNMGVSLMGDFTSVMPTTAARNSLANILSWKADQRGINPLGSSTHASSGRFMANITGHRDWAATACPGNTFYPTLSTVRNSVNDIINGGSAPAPTPPTAPTSSAATQITNTSFRANWQSSANATEYLLDVSLTNTFSSFVGGYNNRNVGNVTSISVTGLTQSTRYHYRVRARNSAGTSGNSSVRQVTTISTLSAPTVLTLPATNITTSGARLRGFISLNGGATVTERRVEWGLSGSWTDFTADVVTTDNVNFYFDVTGLQAGRTYNFRVWARNSVGWSFSATDFFTTASAPAAPPAPGVLSAIHVGENGFTARWNTSSGATNYYIDVGTGTGYALGLTMASDDFEGAFPATGWLAEGNVGKTNSFSRSGSHSAIFVANANVLVSPVVNDPSGISFWTRWSAVGRTTIVEWVQGNVTSTVAEVTSTVANSFEEVGLSFSGLGEGRFRFRRGNAATLYVDDINIMRVGTAAAGYRNRAVGNVTSFNVTGLLPNTLYYYRIRAEGLGGNSPYSANQTVTTLAPPLPATPESLAATHVTNTSFLANWNSAANATEYLLDVSLTNTFSSLVSGYNARNVGNNTSLSVTNLTPATRYFYRVRARNASGTSAHSAVREVNTPAILTAPTVVTLDTTTITAMGARIRGFISLNGGAAVTERRFEWGTGGMWTSWTADVVNSDGVNFHLDLTGLQPGTTYNFRAWARNSVGWSYSATDFFTTTALPSAPPAPVVLSATDIKQTGFTARWNASSGATNYYIDVGTATTYALGNIIASDDFEGEFPSTGWVGDGGIGPTNSVSRSGANSVRFSLNAHALVTPLVNDPSGLTFWTHWAATGRTTTIEWIQGSTTSVVGQVVSTVPNAFEEVGLSFSGLGEGRFRIRRSNAANLHIDDISILTGGTALAGYRNRAVGDVTSFNVTGLLPDTLSYYRVRAEGEGGNSPNSADQSVTTLAPPPPPMPSTPASANATEITNTSFRANWSSSANATEYLLDVSTTNTFSSFISGYENRNVGNVTTLLVTDLLPGTRYHYRVRARNISGTSSNSTTRTVNTPAILYTPTVITLEADHITTNSARIRGRISSNGGASVTERRLEWGTGGTWTSWTNDVVTSGNDFYFDLMGLEPGRTYNFRAWASNLVGWAVSPAEFLTTSTLPTPPEAPDVLSAIHVHETGFTARWNPADGATNYFIDVGTGTSYALGTTMTADDFEGDFPADGWQDEGGIITTTVVARSGTHSVRFSANAHALATPELSNPSGLTFWTRWTSIGRTTVVEWVEGNVTSMVAEVTSTVANSFEEVGLSFAGLGDGYFRLRRGSTATLYIDDIEITYGGTAAPGHRNRAVGGATSFNVTGLIPGTLYFYRVRAEGEAGNSPNSANQSVNTLTPPPPPTPPGVPFIYGPSNITDRSFSFAWTPVAGATHYALDVATSSDFSPGKLAFDESFEGDFPPAGWSHVSIDQSTTHKRTGSFSAFINANGDRLITPEVTNPSRLIFWTRWTAAGRDTAIEWLQGNETTRVATVTSTIPNNFEENIVHFRNLGTGRFQFLRSGNTASVYIDDVTLLVDGSMKPGYNARELSDVSSSTVTGLTESTTYFYRLSAGNDVGLGDFSIVREVETLVSATSMVTNAPVSVPRQWLEHHFGSGHFTDDIVNNLGPNRMPVWHSFVAGLDPNNPDSVLASEARAPPPGETRPVIRWMGTDQPGRRYSIYATTNLTTPFIPIATNLPNRYPAINIYTDHVFNAESGPVYYRIRVDLEP